MFIRSHTESEWFRLIGPGFDAEGLLQGIDEDGAVTVETWVSVEPGRRVVLVNSDLYAAGSVKCCTNIGATNFVGVHLDQPEKRRHARYPVNLAARLRVFYSSIPDEMDVRVIDVSECGMGLMSERPVSTGSNVELTLDYGLVFAQVRYCVLVPDQHIYRVGVEIANTIFKADYETALPPC